MILVLCTACSWDGTFEDKAALPHSFAYLPKSPCAAMYIYSTMHPGSKPRNAKPTFLLIAPTKTAKGNLVLRLNGQGFYAVFRAQRIITGCSLRLLHCHPSCMMGQRFPRSLCSLVHIVCAGWSGAGGGGGSVDHLADDRDRQIASGHANGEALLGSWKAWFSGSMLAFACPLLEEEFQSRQAR